MTNMNSAEVGEAYEATRARMTELAAGMSPEVEMRVVPTCPDWTIRDLISHNVGLATDLAAGNRPDGNTQAWVDAMVENRRDRTVADQLVEWETSGPAFAELMTKHEGLGGLLLDIVAHEHDLAQAMGLQGDRDSRAIEIVMDSIESRLMAADLEKQGLGAVRLVDSSADREWIYGNGDVGFTMTASMFELFRLTGSRRSLAQMRASNHEGDLDRYLSGVLHMPAPEHDIDE